MYYETRFTQPKLPKGTPYGGAAQPSNEIRPTKNYVRIYHRIMQNKPNFRKYEMNLIYLYTEDCKNFIPLGGKKTNPIKPNSKPIQTQLPKRSNPISKMPKLPNIPYLPAPDSSISALSAPPSLHWCCWVHCRWQPGQGRLSRLWCLFAACRLYADRTIVRRRYRSYRPNRD